MEYWNKDKLLYNKIELKASNKYSDIWVINQLQSIPNWVHKIEQRLSLQQVVVGKLVSQMWKQTINKQKTSK